MNLVGHTLAIVALIASTTAGLLSTVKCDPANCKLPDCFCPGTVPPINPKCPHKNPQIVHLNFEDAFTVTNYPLFQEIFGNRRNPNGAHITGSFYISLACNNYNLTQQMWLQGHEIALRTINRRSSSYSKDLSDEEWAAEVIAQKEQAATLAEIPKEDIVGFRPPFGFQGGSDAMYAALYEGGLRYESSQTSFTDCPNLFPYTMDYGTLQDCQIERIPHAVYPGFWEYPLANLIGSNGQPCAVLDTCLDTPKTADETFELLQRNFRDHYNGHRAPFVLSTHAGWLLNEETTWIKEGYLRFIDHILSVPEKDVYIVSIKKGLEWMRHPVDLEEIINFPPWLDSENL